MLYTQLGDKQSTILQPMHNTWLLGICNPPPMSKHICCYNYTHEVSAMGAPRGGWIVSYAQRNTQLWPLQTALPFTCLFIPLTPPQEKQVCVGYWQVHIHHSRVKAHLSIACAYRTMHSWIQTCLPLVHGACVYVHVYRVVWEYQTQAYNQYICKWIT